MNFHTWNNKWMNLIMKKRYKVYLKGGRYDSVEIDKPGTYVVIIPGLIILSYDDWKLVDDKFICINDRPLKAVWTEESEGINLPIWAKFVYKQANENYYEFSHVEQ